MMTAVTGRGGGGGSVCVYEKADSVCARANSSVQGCHQHGHADRFPDFDELECRV